MRCTASEPPEDGGCVVAIADVSACVHPGTALDEEARLRGNSVYFPDRVLPMLPESISNGLCSLRPHEDRLCLGCELIVTGAGRVHRSRFFEGVIRSRGRLTYTEVAEALEQGAPGALGGAADAGAREESADTGAPAERTGPGTGRTPGRGLERWRPCSTRCAMRMRRCAVRAIERGAIDFDMTETRVVLGEDGRVVGLEPVPRATSHTGSSRSAWSRPTSPPRRFLERHRLPALYPHPRGAFRRTRWRSCGSSWRSSA